MGHFTTYLTLKELVRGYRSGEISPLEAVQATLDRVEDVNDKINALYYIDHKAALKEASLSEKRWRGGTPKGSLDGVPTSIKDLLPTKGMPGGFLGSISESGMIAKHDHPAVARMRDAGAVIFGKSTMCDYGIIPGGVSSRFGPTRNPWNLERTPGASSSGPAAAVAAGIEPVSIGTDIVGSIRLPASYCGLAGLKPSRGRVPYHFPNSHAVVAGPLARNVTDLALHMNVLTQPDVSDFTALPFDGRDYTAGLEDFDPTGVRVLLIPDLGMGAKPATEIAMAVEAAAKALSAQGCVIDTLDAPFADCNSFGTVELFYKVRYLTALSKLSDHIAKQSPIVWDWTRDALNLSAVDYYQLAHEVDLVREKVANLIQGYDFLLLPSTQQSAFQAELPAPNPDKMFEPWSNTFLFNLTEQPAASIPCGLDAEGMPIGLQIVGKRFDDIGVLRLARCYERIAPTLPLPTALN